MIQLPTSIDAFWSEFIPPPAMKAEVRQKVQFSSVGVDVSAENPPPLPVAEFLEKTQVVSVGDAPTAQCTAPPL